MEATTEPVAGGRAFPTGTVTFLFTDLEGSTAAQRAHPDAYRDAVRRHHDLLQGAVEAHGGVVFETLGDAVCAAFARPSDAVAAALAGQLALQREAWGATGPLRARMGVHLGEVEAYPAPGAAQGARYLGLPLVRCGRLMGTAHGGQTVLSEAVAVLVRDALPEGAALRDLGEHRLKDLARPERVAQLLHPDLPGEFPPLRSLDARPHNLPLQLTSFVGRERELGEVAALLGAHRLLTLTGPGGTGKTRLALQAAADALEAYPDGVWLVELAALADPALVPQAVAQAVGVREEPGRPLPATLTDALRPRRLLLVLDNCEHLLDACARLADALLRAGPRLTVLATSREALGIAGEVSRRVPSLALPGAAGAPSAETLTQCEAVQLFVQRAVAVQPAFRVTDQNAPAVAQLCARLDGIPLALELAAARVRALPPEPLLARLEDRFRLLTGGSRTALPRQQTLQAAVDWSYDLLSGPERALFARLSVFAGGFALEAAEAVCAGAGGDALEAVDLLTRLVDKSLVAAEELPDGTARYALLETLRQYGRARLVAGGGAAALHARHAAHYLALAEQAEPALHGPAQLAWLGRLEREHDNLRAALAWFAECGPAEDGLRLAAALGSRVSLWVTRGYLAEGRQRLARLLALPGDPLSGARARALDAAGALAWAQGDYAAQQGAAEEALAVYRALGDLPGIATALVELASLALQRGDYVRAQASYDDGAAARRAAGLPPLARPVAGNIARDRGDFAAAWPRYERALASTRAAGDRTTTAHLLSNMGILAHYEEAFAQAFALQAEALALRRELDARREVPNSLAVLGQAAFGRGDVAAARALCLESVPLLRRLGNRWGLARALEGLAAVAAAAGEPARALTLAGAAEGLRQATGRPMPPPERRIFRRWLAPAYAALGAAEAAAAGRAGLALSLDQAAAYALDEGPAPAP